MPKKAFKKKKAWKRACYAKARQGLMNRPDGSFHPIPTTSLDGMVLGYKAGYRIN
jgi:hypothetical protein